MIRLNKKKIDKLKNNPKLFFKDFLIKKIFFLIKIYKKYLFKRYNGYSKYIVISAVYNVDKYLDDYFKSIISQRLDFKKNIFLILVDDGSTDNSAKIIKKYQKKYPNNIVYLYKENGGQASARNLALEYMKENDFKIPWVTFTDPDDFLDRNYFYNVDNFLMKSHSCRVMTCNIVYYKNGSYNYYENNLSFTFKKKHQVIIDIYEKMDTFIFMSAPATFFYYDIIDKYNLRMDNIKPCFEDAKFIAKYLLFCKGFKAGFLTNSLYYYRRYEGSTTSKKIFYDKRYYIDVSKYGTLDILKYSYKHLNYVPKFVQNIVFFHLIWQIKSIINNKEILFFMTLHEKNRYFDVLSSNFKYIDSDLISKSKYADITYEEKIGILNIFKNKQVKEEVFIHDVGYINNTLIVYYYTSDVGDKLEISLDNIYNPIIECKITSIFFLNQNFIYKKIIVLDLSKIFWKLYFKVNNYLIYSKKYNELKFYFNTASMKNIWIFMDYEYEAGGNSELFYRYCKKIIKNDNLFFCLNSNSKDWERLEKENFNLISANSINFQNMLSNAKFCIFSDIDNNIIHKNYSYLGNTKMIFLQNEINIHDNSSKYNANKIDLLITSHIDEHEAIVCNYSKYNFLNFNVKRYGMPRFDYLNNSNVDNVILFYLTSRNYLKVLENRHEILKSLYIKNWNIIFNSDELQDIYKKGYKIVIRLDNKAKMLYKYLNIPYFFAISDKLLIDDINRSKLLITDYSSIGIDMAILNKPTIYFQFDYSSVFNCDNLTYKKGYFNYNSNDFCKVVHNKEDLFFEVSNYLKNSFKIISNVKKDTKHKNCCFDILNELNKV